MLLYYSHWKYGKVIDLVIVVVLPLNIFNIFNICLICFMYYMLGEFASILFIRCVSNNPYFMTVSWPFLKAIIFTCRVHYDQMVTYNLILYAKRDYTLGLNYMSKMIDQAHKLTTSNFCSTIIYVYLESSKLNPLLIHIGKVYFTCLYF